MTVTRRDPAERFWEKVAEGDPDECWEWQAARGPNGYGYFGALGTGSNVAHRWAYENRIGPVPEGLELDHLCRNRACVNPNHLEPVTHKENMRRGKQAQQTHCRHGHPLAGENLYVEPNGKRHCRTCRHAAWHRHFEAKGCERRKRLRREARAVA